MDVGDGYRCSSDAGCVGRCVDTQLSEHPGTHSHRDTDLKPDKYIDVDANGNSDVDTHPHAHTDPYTSEFSDTYIHSHYNALADTVWTRSGPHLQWHVGAVSLLGMPGQRRRW